LQGAKELLYPRRLCKEFRDGVSKGLTGLGERRQGVRHAELMHKNGPRGEGPPSKLFACLNGGSVHQL